MGKRAELGWEDTAEVQLVEQTAERMFTLVLCPGEGTAEVQLVEQTAKRMLTLVLCPDGHFSM